MSFEIQLKMAFTPLHYLPATLSALLIIVLALRGRSHRAFALAMACFGLLGLAGYISGGSFRFSPLDQHVLHSLLGLTAFLLSIGLVLDRVFTARIKGRTHCRLGYMAAAFASLSLITGLFLLSGIAIPEPVVQPGQNLLLQVNATPKLPEVEALEFRGAKLMPVARQGNNAISGTQAIDRATYRLQVTGLVNQSLNLSYNDLLKLPAYSEVAYMPCVEGWGFSAKWTGFRVSDLLNRSGTKPGASYVVFHTAEGYSTGLPLDYLRDNQTLLAYGLNDLTLPPDRGFPFQLVAKGRYGYKWAKWITGIEVTDKEVRGYWESRGYSNSAKRGEFPFG